MSIKIIICLIIKFFLTIASYQFFLRMIGLSETWLIFSKKLFSTSLLFPILKEKFSVAEILRRIFCKETLKKNLPAWRAHSHRALRAQLASRAARFARKFERA